MALVDKLKRAMQPGVTSEAIDQRAELTEARKQAASAFRQDNTALAQELERIETLKGKAMTLHAQFSEIEREQQEAASEKDRILARYAHGQSSETEVVEARARLERNASRARDIQELLTVVKNELIKQDADWPAPESKRLRNNCESTTRQFWAATYAELKVTEAPADVRTWILRCWAAYQISGHGGMAGMYADLFGREFSLSEVEQMRRDLEVELT